MRTPLGVVTGETRTHEPADQQAEAGQCEPQRSIVGAPTRAGALDVARRLRALMSGLLRGIDVLHACQGLARFNHGRILRQRALIVAPAPDRSPLSSAIAPSSVLGNCETGTQRQGLLERRDRVAAPAGRAQHLSFRDVAVERLGLERETLLTRASAAANPRSAASDRAASKSTRAVRGLSRRAVSKDRSAWSWAPRAASARPRYWCTS